MCNITEALVKWTWSENVHNYMAAKNMVQQMNRKRQLRTTFPFSQNHRLLTSFNLEKCWCFIIQLTIIKTYKACRLCHRNSTEYTKDVTGREEHVGVGLSHAVMWVMGLSLQSSCTCSHYIATYGEKDIGAE